MHKALSSQSTTVFVSTVVVLVLILAGLSTVGIAIELEKARRMAGLSGSDEFDPNTLPAPASGGMKYESGRSQAVGHSRGFGYLQESGRPLDCEGVVFMVAEDGTRFVRESGGGRYYAVEVNNAFSIYTLDYGYLVQAENSSLDTYTYRKLKHALYHCDGVYTESGLQLVLNIPENK